VQVKLNEKVKVLVHFLRNYQKLFYDGMIGPFDVQISRRSKYTSIESFAYTGEARKVEWRPVVLYPEDFIAF
jgi:hypothetical protein